MVSGGTHLKSGTRGRFLVFDVGKIKDGHLRVSQGSWTVQRHREDHLTQTRAGSGRHVTERGLRRSGRSDEERGLGADGVSGCQCGLLVEELSWTGGRDYSLYQLSIFGGARLSMLMLAKGPLIYIVIVGALAQLQ